MTDTVRLRAALAALFPDNTSGDISPQDLRDFLASALLEIIEYPASSVGGIRIRPIAGSGTSDIVRLGRYGTGALIGIAVGNQAHVALFRDDFATELWHWDLSDGAAKGTSLGIDWMAGHNVPRVVFPTTLPNAIYGGRPAFQIGLPQRGSDPATDTDSGTVSFAAAGSLTDTTKAWTDDQFHNYIVEIYSGLGVGQMRYVNTNNAIQLVFETGARWAIIPNATSLYRLYQVRAGDMWYDNALNVVKYFDGTAVKTVATV